jgi:hypothetical protein
VLKVREPQAQPVVRPRSDRPVRVAQVLLVEMVSPDPALGLAPVCAAAKPVAGPPAEHLDLQVAAAPRRLGAVE